MKGLILNNYYSAQDSIKISLLISALLVILTLFVNDTIAVSMLSFIIFIFPTNNISSLQADESSKWNKFELTTPVSRNQIIFAKYISYIGTVILGIVFSLIAVVIMIVTGRKIELNTLIYPILFGTSLSLLTGSILYPLLIKLGALKSELFMIISAVLAVVLILSLWTVVNKFFFTVDFKSTTTGTISCIFSIVLFIISFLCTNRIYHKKQF